jgi:hypothetical protein
MASLEFQRNLKNRIELSVVKWGKHSTRVWSYTVRFFYKKRGKKYISIQGGWKAQQTINFGSKLSFIIHLVFPFSWAPLLLLDTFWLLLLEFTLEPFALNVEFQDFILRYVIKISYFAYIYHWKRG